MSHENRREAAQTGNIQPVVIVPVHKTNPDAMEVVSIRNCGVVFEKRRICFVAPERLDLQNYYALIPAAEQIKVPGHWMESMHAYNTMMISPSFFRLVGNCSHILIHEPDAIALRDELDHWCVQPFDYIGAPWWSKSRTDSEALTPRYVGNYGFSLIRLSAAINALQSEKRWYAKSQVLADFILGMCGNAKLLRRGKLASGEAGKLRGAWQLYGHNCDIFWSFAVPTMLPEFRIAGVRDALEFSWETFPQRCFDLCEGRPPFGFHAWAKFDPGFVLPLLQANGVNTTPVAPMSPQKDSSHVFKHPRRVFRARKAN
jgi:hypothetical protein